MYKTMITALATSALMLNTAFAAPQNQRYDRPAASQLGGDADARALHSRDSMSARASASMSTRDGLENRSMFYQGPTYIGRY